MSDIKIQPSATGSGTVTITAPTTNTARVITLPDGTGTLATTADITAHTDTTKLPLAGGTMTGTIAGFTSTGIDDNATSNAITIANNGYIDFGAYQNTPTSSHGIQIRSGDGQLFVSRNGTGTNNMVFFKNSNGTVGRIDTSGTSTSYNTSSDYRLKENVDYTWDATTRLKQLKPARFNFIADDTNTLVDGFIAHEVSSVVPEAITGEKDATEMQGIDQSKLVPLLVKTIQELEARLTAGGL